MERSRAAARAYAAGAVIVLLPPLRHGRCCAVASLLPIWTAPRPSSRSPNGRTFYRRRERARDRGDNAAWWQQRVQRRRCRNCRTRAALLMQARAGVESLRCRTPGQAPWRREATAA
ncbi:hypothetical protein SORBI_3004G135300 [Sorghum bicolor]|uniref:Uncharacterized protein n=1 Tax=Sorghum bicolor TaxID=4558 RepID=A0A194YPJ9_SORBI|nr:hypothetical protein SORBI_3004G135300 [Sorghum bicolor]